MALEWIRIGAVSPAVHESLLSRFMRCRAKDRCAALSHRPFSRMGTAMTEKVATAVHGSCAVAVKVRRARPGADRIAR